MTSPTFFGFAPSGRPTLWGRDLWGWGSTSEAVAGQGSIVKDLYRLEVTTKNGNTIARLPNVGSGHFVDWRNRINQLQFTYPAEDEASANFVFPNKIRLFNRSGEVVEMYHVATKELRSDVSGRQVFLVEGESTKAQLGREVHSSYSAAPGTTVEIVVRELLEQFQEYTAWAKIYYGSIDSSIRDHVLDDGLELRNFTILNALHQLRAMVAGSSVLSVTTSNRLRWTRPPSFHTGNRLNLGRNMQQLSIKTDYRTIATRVVGYGAGMDDNRLSTVKNALTQNLYGIVLSVFSDPKIKEQDRLDEVVQKLVDRLGAPLQRISADAIDLSLVEDSRYDFSVDTLDLNAPFTLLADGLITPFITTIQGIGRDMFAPAHVQLMLTDPAAGAAGLNVGPGTGFSEVWAGNLDAIIMDAIDMLAELLAAGRDLAEGLSMIEYLVQYFVENPEIVETFIPFEDTVPTLYHDYASPGVSTNARRGDARPALDAKLARVFHGADQDAIDAQESPSGSPPVVFKARDLAVLAADAEIKAWIGNPSNDPDPGEWVRVGGANTVYVDETVQDIIDNNPATVFREYDFAYTTGATTPANDSEKEILWIWNGNPSDDETTPGEFKAINRRFYQVADETALDALEDVLPGALALQDDDPDHPRIFWGGKWFYLPLMLKAADRTALDALEDKFPGVLGMNTTGVLTQLWVSIEDEDDSFHSTVLGNQSP